MIELMDCTNVLLQEILDKKAKRIDIARTYAFALKSSFPTDWAKVNHAIINRWSISALEYIKNMAWSGKAFKLRRGKKL